MKSLTQDELNAGCVIDALARLIATNTNPKFGFGKDTLELVSSHIQSWDFHNKRELIEAFKRFASEIKMPMIELAELPDEISVDFKKK